jgi:competence protein ComEA
MLYSLLVKLGMLAVAIGMVVWIGWTVPQSHQADAGRGAEVQANVAPSLRSTEPPAAAAAPVQPFPQPQTSGKIPPRSPVKTLDVNQATAQEFEVLPGIGPVLAERIVEYRQARGAFRNVEQLRHVKGIGKKKFDRIRTLISVTPLSGSVRGGKRTT